MIEELKKLFRGKLFVSLLLLSVMVNVGLLLMQKGKIDGLRVIDDFCRENGSVVSEEKVEQLSKTCQMQDLQMARANVARLMGHDEKEQEQKKRVQA